MAQNNQGELGLVPSNYLKILSTTSSDAQVACALERVGDNQCKLTVKTQKLNGLFVASYQIRKRVI